MFEQALRLLRSDIAIELGSARTKVFVRGQGLLFDEPSLVLTKNHNKKEKIVCVGKEAQQFLGRTPESMNIHTPIQKSISIHPNLSKALLQHAVEKSIGGQGLLKPKILLLIPHGIRTDEKKQLLDILYTVGSRESVYIDSLLCAGLGLGLPINEPIGSLVLDIGHGTSKVGVLSMSGIVASAKSNVGGEQINQYIISHAHEQNHRIGQVTANTIKEAIGEAVERDAPRYITFTCRDSLSGQPKEIQLQSSDITPPITKALQQISVMIRALLTKLSPELCADVLQYGMMICGGSAKLYGMDEFFSHDLNIPVFVHEQPELRSILGAGALLEDQHLLDWMGEAR